MSVEDSYDSFVDDGEMKLTLHSMIYQQESENISKNVKFGIAEKSRHGIFHGTPPYGYDKVKGRLVPNVTHAPTVKLIFDLYLSKGMGMQAIANYLTDKKVPTPRAFLGAKNAGTVWQQNAVKIILTNPHYTGDLVQGRSKTDIKDKAFNQEKGYKKRLQVDKENWIVVPRTHEALITHEQFQEVQQMMSKKAEKIFRGKGKKSLFARLAYCAECGAGLNYKNDRRGYVCATYQKNGRKKCDSHFTRHEVLKEKVLSDLRELSTNSLNMNSLLDIALKRAGSKMIGAKDELKRVQQELKQLAKEQTQLARNLARELIDENTFKSCMESIKNELQVWRQRELELERLLSKEKDTEVGLHAFRKEIAKFIELNITDEEMLRQVLHRLIDKVEVSKDGSITIHYNFQNPMSMGA
jgi:site-specific DNA recombinase